MTYLSYAWGLLRPTLPDLVEGQNNDIEMQALNAPNNNPNDPEDLPPPPAHVLGV